MSWNYRIVSYTDERGDAWYGIREVYYNDNGEVWAVTSVNATGAFEGVQDLLKDLHLMFRSGGRPVLELDGLEYAPCPWSNDEEVEILWSGSDRRNVPAETEDQ